MRVLVTSGGTRVPIDRVRFIANMSNGTFGSRITRSLVRLMSEQPPELTFLTAKHATTPFEVTLDPASMDDAALLASMGRAVEYQRLCRTMGDRYREVVYTDFVDYASKLKALLATQPWDLVIFAAAVSDYLVDNYVDGKVRSSAAEMAIQLTPAEKLITQARGLTGPATTLVGFKLLVDSTDAELIDAARHVAVSADCQFVVANDLRDIQANAHRALIVYPEAEMPVRVWSSAPEPERMFTAPEPYSPDALAMKVADLAFTEASLRMVEMGA